MLPTEIAEETERRLHKARITRVEPRTGEIVGETEWRRWRTESGWHPATPQEIRDKYGWLFATVVEGIPTDADHY